VTAVVTPTENLHPAASGNSASAAANNTGATAGGGRASGGGGYALGLSVAAVDESSVEASQVGDDGVNNSNKRGVVRDLVDTVCEFTLELIEHVLNRAIHGVVGRTKKGAVACCCDGVLH